jgi:hypothetical protein
MTINLPAPIAAYFVAEGGASEALAHCFTPTAVVKDEGHTYNGKVEIQRWKTESSTKYTYTSEPFTVEEKDGKIIVISRLTGNFPGSPTNLRYFFELDGNKIAALEIIP